MSRWCLLAMAQPAGLHSARIFAVFAFMAVLGALAWALWRARQRLMHDEVDAALERDFQRLEQETARRDAE
ncbi:MAG TPA: hypothetical protein VEQ58_01575 [Polyangiaceae bacterium]|nr:hypothetical protein [Polyangiaceae bacterium]